MILNNVKMVIWDLDETFWSGTLAEGAITPIPENKDIVVTLAKRGIISSICSKNDHAKAEAALTELGIWSYFVFPKIEFGPKGQNIATIIETAGLRPQNVLFIDDNLLNREEARHVSPGLMVADPGGVLPSLLGLSELAGKDDRALTRLQQYKTIEVKAVERANSSQGNEDFLRSCRITVDIDYDIESKFDRVIELANRTNQLNYTKQRLETPEAVEAFRALLSTYGVTAGLIRVSDKYGDYGIVGYFVLHRKAGHNDLPHFVFSCRTMNMGIEQYVYERLQTPAIKIVPPVANQISAFKKVDWITEGASGTHALGHVTSGQQLLLIGGCELLQIASMCSSNREEFVNTVRNKWPVRFDDVGFIAGDRQKIGADKAIEKLNYWTYKDTQRFDLALANSDILIVALFANLGWSYFESEAGTRVRIAEDNLRRHLRADNFWFVKNFRHIKLSMKDKLDLIATSLDKLAASSPPAARRFAFGVATKKMTASERLAAAGWPACLRIHAGCSAWLQNFNSLPAADRYVGARHLFNRFVEDYCNRTKAFQFVDVDSIVTADDVFDPDPQTGHFLPDHFSRRAYIAIAASIAEGFAWQGSDAAA
jgi:FkbH-like protein